MSDDITGDDKWRPSHTMNDICILTSHGNNHDDGDGHGSGDAADDDEGDDND